MAQIGRIAISQLIWISKKKYTVDEAIEISDQSADHYLAFSQSKIGNHLP